MRSLSKFCFLLLTAGLLAVPISSTAASRSKTKKKKSKTESIEKPEVDKYTKMFINDKSCITARGGFLTLHKLNGKLYHRLRGETKVLLISNDPHHPFVIVQLKARREAPEQKD